MAGAMIWGGLVAWCVVVYGFAAFGVVELVGLAARGCGL
jgi:hypothetical protein